MSNFLASELDRFGSTDSLMYAKTVKFMGLRTKAATLDFSEIFLDAAVEDELKEEAVTSMGTEITDQELHIQELCDQVVSLSEYRPALYDSLTTGMINFAPNLTALVGELVGSRLIAHAGGLSKLVNLSVNSIVMLGSNESGCRAVNGLISHASLVGQVAPRFKKNIIRSVAAKVALASRHDAHGAGQNNTFGLACRPKLETRVADLQRKPDKTKHEHAAKIKQEHAAKIQERRSLGHLVNTYQNTTLFGNSSRIYEIKW